MAPLYDLILQRKGKLHTKPCRWWMPPRPGAWGVSAIPTASAALCVAMLGVMALQLSHPKAAKRRASERPGMELRLESRAERSRGRDGAVFQDPAGGGLLR